MTHTALMTVMTQLESAVDLVNRIVDRTRSTDGNWSTAYGLIFSTSVSGSIRTLLSSIGQNLDYYDPDTSYEEDVEAYVRAVNDKMEELRHLIAD